VTEDAAQQLGALEGEAAARFAQGRDEYQFLQSEAAKAEERFAATRAAELARIDALKDTYTLVFVGTFIRQLEGYALDVVHEQLEVLGTLGDFIPGVGWAIAAGADLINAAIYAAEGEWIDMGASAFSIIPFGNIAKRAGLDEAAGRAGKFAARKMGGVVTTTSHAVLPKLGHQAHNLKCPVKHGLGRVGCFKLGTLVADGGDYGSQYVATADADSRLYWAMMVGALSMAGLVYGVSRRRRKDEENRAMLDGILRGPDDHQPDDDELDVLALGVAEATGRPRETASDRVLAVSEALFDRADVRCAVLDKPPVKRTIKDVGQAFQRDTVRESAPRMSTTTHTKPRSSPSRWWSLRWPVIGLLLLVAGFFGFEAIRASSEPAREKVTFRSSPDVRFINGVPFRPIETYDVCHRVLGKNPLLTDEDRAAFGPEPDPATWKLLELRCPKLDGSWAFCRTVRPPEWLAEQCPIVGGHVYIWVPECGIEGDAEVLSIGPCPPVTPGRGRVVTSTFRHEVDGLVEVHVEGLADAIGCTGNHPFWSEDRRDFVRTDELQQGDSVLALNGPARVTMLKAMPGRQTVYNLEVQGEHVYMVTPAGVLVHNGVPTWCDIQKWVNKAGGFINPATNKWLRWLRKEPLQPDHIYPLKEIRKLMDGRTLTAKQKQFLETLPTNTQPLPKGWNQSKGSIVHTLWEAYFAKNRKVHPDYAKALAEKQEVLERHIQNLIDFFEQGNLGP